MRLVLSVLLALGACRTSAPRMEARSVVEEGNARLAAAARAQDPEAIAAVYSQDALMLAPGGARHEGRAAVLDYWRSSMPILDWKLEVLETGGGGRTVWQLGRSTLVRERDGARRESTVEYCAIWRRADDGVWYLAVDAWFPPAPR